MSNTTLNSTLAHDGLHKTLGPILIGATLSTFVWGINSTQTCDYLMDNADRLRQRLTVIFLWMLDTLTSIMDCHMTYRVLVTNFGNPSLPTPQWSTSYYPMVSGISNLIIRTLFSRRIYFLSGESIILTTWIMILSIGDFAVCIVLTVVAITNGLQDIRRLMYLTFGFGIAADFSVTVALCWLLRSDKSWMRRSRPNFIVNILVIYVVTTGLLVTLDATIALVTYVTMPNSTIFYPFVMLLDKLYFNAYLSLLNTRTKIERKDTSQSTSIPLSRLYFGQGMSTEMSGDTVPKTTGKLHNQTIPFQTTIDRRADDVEHDVKDSSGVE